FRFVVDGNRIAVRKDQQSGCAGGSDFADDSGTIAIVALRSAAERMLQKPFDIRDIKDGNPRPCLTHSTFDISLHGAFIPSLGIAAGWNAYQVAKSFSQIIRLSHKRRSFFGLDS